MKTGQATAGNFAFILSAKPPGDYENYVEVKYVCFYTTKI